MGALVLLLAIAAYLRPSLTAVFESAWITPLLGVVMFGMGLTLEASDFKIISFTFSQNSSAFIILIALS